MVVKSDGSIWFTDPTYGIDSEYEGDAAPSEIGASQRLPHRPGDRRGHPGRRRHASSPTASPSRPTRACSTSPTPAAPTTPSTRRRSAPTRSRCDKTAVHDGRDFATCDAGLFDGFRVDTDGNVWSSAGDGVHVFAPDGTLIGKILVPEVVANVCFGGRKRNRLFICATTSLFALYVNAQGCPY